MQTITTLLPGRALSFGCKLPKMQERNEKDFTFWLALIIDFQILSGSKRAWITKGTSIRQHGTITLTFTFKLHKLGDISCAGLLHGGS